MGRGEIYAKSESLEGRQASRPKRRWEYIIKTDIKETWCESVDWIHLPQDRIQWWILMNTVMNFRVPYEASNVLTN